MTATFSRIAIVGAGAIGGYYGALLARAGFDVHFLLRSDWEAVQERGLNVRLPQESFQLHPVNAHKTPDEIGPCDLVIIALKATGNDALPRLLPPLLHAGTTLLTLENGLGSDEFLAQKFGPERVVGGLCFICVNRTAPGQIWCMQPGSITFAEHERPAGERVAQLAEMFRKAGVKCATSDDLAEVRWKKLVWNVPFNGLSIAAGGITTDKILAEPRLEAEVRGLMEEVIAGAASLGHSIPSSFADRQIEITRPMGPYKPSSLIDFMAKREVEVEAIWGEPLRRAQAAGASLPKLALLYALLGRLTKKD